MAANFGLATPKKYFYSKLSYFGTLPAGNHPIRMELLFPDSINTKTISAGELEAKL